MSRFSGRHGRGARAQAREIRMYQAYLRQVDGQQRERDTCGKPWTYESPEYFLTAAAREQVTRGNVDPESFRGVR